MRAISEPAGGCENAGTFWTKCVIEIVIHPANETGVPAHENASPPSRDPTRLPGSALLRSFDLTPPGVDAERFD
jgi:hypothetical protein